MLPKPSSVRFPISLSNPELRNKKPSFADQSLNLTMNLPPMTTFEDAFAVSNQHQDGFYLTAFVLEGWLGQLLEQAVAQYAERPPTDRFLQTGHARVSFDKLFGHAPNGDLPAILDQLWRFSRYDGESLPRILGKAHTPLSIEHDQTGEFVNIAARFRPRGSSTSSTLSATAIRSTIHRWCDWVDAVVHWQVHEHSHLSPLSFDPDPQKRQLADFGQALTFSAPAPSWPNRDLERAAISIWPLVERYCWSTADFLSIVRSLLPAPHPAACHSPRSLLDWCSALGLRYPKTKPNSTRAASGFAIAKRIYQPACSRRG